MLKINLEDQNQSVLANISSGNLFSYLQNDTNIVLSYQLSSEFRNIVPAHWTGNPELDYLINGNLEVQGRGIDPESAWLDLQARLNESRIADQSFSDIMADLEFRSGDLSGVIKGSGAFGRFHVAPAIRDITGNPSYYVSLTTSGLNLAVLTGTDSLESNINLQARIDGRSFDPKTISADAEIVMSESRFQEITFDTLIAKVQYANENVQIDSLWLQTQTLSAEAKGNYSLNSTSDMHLTLNFKGLEEFESFIPAMDLSTSGILEAHLSGTPDSLDLEAILRLDSTRYDTITLSSLRLLASGRITPTDTLFDATMQVYNIDLGGFKLDSVNAQMDGSPDSVFLRTSIVNPDINTRLHAGIVPGEKLRITIPEWEIKYKNQEWFLQQPAAYIEIDSANYFIDNFRLVSDETDSAQYISLQGLISRDGKEDFMLEAGNINISKLAETFDAEFEGSGLANLDINLKGTSESPLIEGSFDIRNALVNEYRFNELRGNMNYADGIMNVESLIIPQDSGRFEVTANLPLQLNLDTMGFHFSPDDSINAQVFIEEFSLGILNSFNIPLQTTGFLEGKVDVSGTANSPNPEGNIRLVDASFAMREYGIDYRDVKLNLNFLRDRIELDTFRIQTSDGDVTGTGLVNFGSDFYKGDITDSKITLNFNGFNPVNHRQFNMEVDGIAELKGEADSVVFSGDLRIPQAEFYLPAIFSLMGRMQTAEMPKPILVQELENMSISLDSLGIMEFEKKKPDSASFNYFDQLKGQIRVRIPRNTWIKNDDMRIEISGELEVIKNADFFELFGQVEVIRGQYELLGRAFVIDEGTVNFQGGEEMNLRMDIAASYSFRNTRQVQQELTVKVSGTPEEPEVTFELDGSSIEEGDALSYLLFGKSMDELSINEQSNVESAGGGSLAAQAAASLVSAQLTSFLQDKLDVDYIEVKSGGGFNEATVVVGKYITNKLFVSYEQRFGQTDVHNPKKYEVKLEYELFRFLFFELNNSTIDSGFDVIYKFDVL
jgi:translocation and assembly module TamB